MGETDKSEGKGESPLNEQGKSCVNVEKGVFYHIRRRGLQQNRVLWGYTTVMFKGSRQS